MALKIGMRRNTLSQISTTLLPMKLRVASPIRKMISNVRMVPSPGMRKPNSTSGCQRAGNSSSDWSMVLMMRFKTHSVIARGSRISRPVMKYLRMACSVGNWSGGVCSRCRRRGRGRCGGRRRIILCGRFVICWLAAGILEVRGVPAGALELEAGRRHLLAKTGLAARGAIGQHRVGHPLQHVLGEIAFNTAVGIDRHRTLPAEIVQNPAL